MADELQKVIPVAIVFIVAAIVLGFGAVVLSDISTDLLGQGTNSTNSQYTVAVTDTTDVVLDNYWFTNCAATVTSVLNETGRVVIESANYTVTNCSIKGVADTMSGAYNGTSWIINYTYTFDDENTEYNIISNGTDTLDTMGKYLPTMALIVIAGLIITLVLGAFYLGRR